MAGSPSIEQIVAQIRTALFGKDVRENIALGIEKCYEDSENNAKKSEVELTTYREAFIYSDGQISFTIDGTSIKFSHPRILVNYRNTSGNMNFFFVPQSNGEITVPHDYFAIVNLSNRNLEVKSYDELHSLSNSNYVVLFYNSNGNIKGYFEKYYNKNQIDSSINSINNELNTIENNIPGIELEADGSLGIIAKTSTVHNIPANYNDTDYFLNFYTQVSEGDHYILCYHDGDSGSSTTHDRFKIQGKPTLESSDITTIYAGPDSDHTSGWKVAHVNIPFTGQWRFGRNVDGNTNGFSIPFYAVCDFDPTNIIPLIIAKNAVSEAHPYSSNVPSFSLSGSTISFYCYRILVYYYSNDSTKLKYKIHVMDNPIQVPHDYHLIYNISSETLQVISDNDLRALNDALYTHLFYNSNGNVKGEWYKYCISNSLSEDTDLGFYGVNARPSFTVDESKNVIVNINSAVARYNKSQINYGIGKDQIRGGNTFSFPSQQYVVPHDHCLVFDSAAGTVTVENANFAYSPYKQLLFYNSNGSVNGPWRIYWLEEKNQELPNYYKTHIRDKSRAISLLLKDITSGGGFVFINDIHYNSNALNSPKLVKEICNQTGIVNIHLNGDYINKETSGKDAALQQMNRIMNLYKYPDKEVFATVGNHEFNNPAAQDTPEALAIQLSASDMKYSFQNFIKHRVGGVSDNSNAPLTYWYDDPYAKIRYFVGEVGRGSGIVSASVKWIGQQLENTPSDYGAVIVFHTILGYTKSGDVYTAVLQNSASATLLVNIMDAARAKTSYTYGDTTYNYSGKTFEMIAAFCGDTHVDLNYTTSGGVPIICTTTDSFQEEGGLTRTWGDITEQAFDVVVINRSTKKIYCTRIGAGSDREFTYQS